MYHTRKIRLAVLVGLLGIGGGSLYWVVESALGAYILQAADFTAHTISLASYLLWQRVLMAALIAGVIFCVGLVLVRYRQAENAYWGYQRETALLRENEDEYHRLIELCPYPIALQCENHIVLMNSAGLALLGARNLEQVTRKSVWDFVSLEFREGGSEQHDIKAGPYPPEVRLHRPDGATLVAEMMAVPVSYKGKLALQVIFSDTTERRQAEKEIQQRTKELTILNSIADTVSRSLDLDRILNSAVDEVLKMDFLGDKASCMLFLVNEQTGELLLKVNRGATENHPCLSNPPRIGECLCGLAVKEGQVITCEDDRKDPRHIRQWEGMPVHQDICLPFKVGDKTLGALNLRFPVTHAIAPSDYQLLKAVSDQIAVAVEKAQLFEAVSQQRHRLHYLAVRLTEAEETERQRLARELHDQIGQNLLGLSINLSIIGSQIPHEDTAKQARSCLQDSLALVEQTTERIRAVMADLRPPVLDDYGLVAALRWYSDQVARRTGIAVEVRGEESGTNLSATTEMALFRVAQEALTNVSKHAHATYVTVTLERENGVQRLVIADDGKGFDATHRTGPEEDRGWGLLIMAERAEALGGRFWVESLPSKGTRVIVEIER